MGVPIVDVTVSSGVGAPIVVVAVSVGEAELSHDRNNAAQDVTLHLWGSVPVKEAHMCATNEEQESISAIG